MITEEIVLTMPGLPRPKGSLRCTGGRGEPCPVCKARPGHYLVEDNKQTDKWRTELVKFLRPRVPVGADPHEPVGVEVTFTLNRPRSHLGTGRNDGLVKASAPKHPTTKPNKSELAGGDVDKLARLVLDALQDAGVLPDDAQVVELVTRKAYEKTAGVPDALLYPGLRIRIYNPFEGI